MNEREKNDSTIIAEAYKQMTPEQKQYFVGSAQGAADMARQTGEKQEKTEPAEYPA